MKIDLILLSQNPHQIAWPLGNIMPIQCNTASVVNFVTRIERSTTTDAWLFWDPMLGQPDPQVVANIYKSTGDIWHAGLLLGTGGKPVMLDFIHPTWMLNCDADSHVGSASWRLSFRACLVKLDVVMQMGVPQHDFVTLLGAGLEWGYRLIKLGVVIRHTPELLPNIPAANTDNENLPAADELLFSRLRFNKFWFSWSVFRALASGALPRMQVLKQLLTLPEIASSEEKAPYKRELKCDSERSYQNIKVSVLLPTIDRYPYLRTLLHQLREQTIKPYEIIVIDQTDKKLRDNSLVQEFSDLPLIYIEQEVAGQCSSRNKGLLKSTGDFILFLDDDDEVSPDLIEKHIENLTRFNCDVSCGIADEVGVDSLPGDLTLTRTSDVFPTNNSMIKREVLYRSGLFDLAYDRGQRADGDLGMRVYLSGHHMVLNPEISVLHHHAPMGGLRTHGQRVVTRASSRKKLLHMNLASRSDIYLSRRYFTARQVREMLWISALAIFSVRGSVFNKTVKIITRLFLLPFAIYRLRNNYRDAESLLKHYPQIGSLDKYELTT